MIEVDSVIVQSKHKLVLVFNTGEKKLFDMTPYLAFSVYKRLQNAGFFSLAHVDYGTVVWPGDVDIAPETLYEESIPLS